MTLPVVSVSLDLDIVAHNYTTLQSPIYPYSYVLNRSAGFYLGFLAKVCYEKNV